LTHHFCTSYQILTNVQKFFALNIRRKLVIILLLKIPPHVKCVPTLPCEMLGVIKARIQDKTTSLTHILRN